MSATNKSVELPSREKLAHYIFDLDVDDGIIPKKVLKSLDYECTNMMRVNLGVGNRRMIRRDGRGDGNRKNKPSMIKVQNTDITGINGIYISDGKWNGGPMYTKRLGWATDAQVCRLFSQEVYDGSLRWFISITPPNNPGTDEDVDYFIACENDGRGGIPYLPYPHRFLVWEPVGDLNIDALPPSTDPFDFSVKTELTSAKSKLSPRMVLAQFLLDLDSFDGITPEVLEMIDYKCSKILQLTKDRLQYYIHNLCSELDNEEKVRSLVRKFPEMLSCRRKNGDLPIHSAAASLESVSFVPMLAQERAKNGNTFDGGLLCENSDGISTLEILACSFSEYDPSYDSEYTNVLKELWEMKLLTVHNLTGLNILSRCCHHWSRRRFKFLFGKSSKAEIARLLHGVLESLDGIPEDETPRIKMALKASIERYPQHAGFLFHFGVHQSWTAYEFAKSLIGKRRMMKLIKECIPVHFQFPILHHVVKKMPEHVHDFAQHFPSAVFLRDENNRSFHHVAFISGFYNFKGSPMPLLLMPDEKIEEKDPYLDLYPFMSAAAAKYPDLTTIFYLLQRCPWVVDDLVHGHTTINQEQGTKKQLA